MKKFICKHPWAHFEVNNPNGDVTMCCDNNTVLGNINDGGLEKVWNGQGYRKMRRRMCREGAHAFCPLTCPVLNGRKAYQNLDWYKDLDPQSAAYKNAEINERELAEGKETLQSLPRWMRFTYSYHCNLDCYHCYQRKEATQNTKLSTSFLEEIKTHADLFQVIFPFGGEPFLYKPVIDMLKNLKTAQGCRFFFVTNATLITESTINALRRRNLGLIAVSLDGATEKTFNALRVRGRKADWGQVLANLQRLSELKKEKDFQFTMSMTVNTQNCNEIEAFVGLVITYDAEPLLMLVSNPYETHAFQKHYLSFTKEQFSSIAGQIELSLKKVQGRNMREAEISLIQLRDQLLRHRLGENQPWIYMGKTLARRLFRHLPEFAQRQLKSIIQQLRRKALF